MINLIDCEKSIKDFIQSSIEDFIQEYRSEEIFTVSIYSSPVNGWLNISIDTYEHSQKHVNEFKHRGTEWYGIDNQVEFCNNCPDFKFADYRSMYFEQWVEEYQEKEIINIKVELNKIININVFEEGDEAINRVFFNYFISLFENYNNNNIELTKCNQHRTGVQILDSECIKFWTL